MAGGGDGVLRGLGVCVKVPLQQESYKPLKKKRCLLKEKLLQPQKVTCKITCFNIRPNKMWTFMCVWGGGRFSVNLLKSAVETLTVDWKQL